MGCYVSMLASHTIFDQTAALIRVRVAVNDGVDESLVVASFRLSYEDHVIFDPLEPRELFDNVPLFQYHDF